MSSAALTKEEREEFLTGAHVGVLGVDRPGRAPLTIPIWYDYAPGGDILLWIDPGSVKADLIKAAGKFSLSAQREERPYRYATAEGPVVGWEEPVPVDIATAIAARYLRPDEVAGYVESVLAGPSLLVRMRPKLWSSMDEDRLMEILMEPTSTQ